MKRIGLAVLCVISVWLSACNAAGLTSGSPAPTQIPVISEKATETPPLVVNSPIPLGALATPSLTPTATVPDGKVGATAAPNAPTKSVAPPAPPAGWQIVKASKNPACQTYVPGGWRIVAKIAGAYAPSGNTTYATVAYAGEKDWADIKTKVADWDKFKAHQISAFSPTRTVDNTTTRLWIEADGDGKTTQKGTTGIEVFRLGASKAMCQSNMNIDKEDNNQGMKDTFKKIAEYVHLAE